MRLGLAPLVLAAFVAACSAPAPAPRTIRVDMQGVKFVPSSITARPGERVRFVLRNSDAVDHEFVIGDEAFQKEHRADRPSTGGMHHGETPGVAEVAKGKTVRMEYTFPDEPATLEIACYVEGHYEAGMRGVVTIRA